jgi:uncharacterized tellurite resistance protein B-like protein
MMIEERSEMTQELLLSIVSLMAVAARVDGDLDARAVERIYRFAEHYFELDEELLFSIHNEIHLHSLNRNLEVVIERIMSFKYSFEDPSVVMEKIFLHLSWIVYADGYVSENEEKLREQVLEILKKYYER